MRNVHFCFHVVRSVFVAIWRAKAACGIRFSKTGLTSDCISRGVGGQFCGRNIPHAFFAKIEMYYHDHPSVEERGVHRLNETWVSIMYAWLINNIDSVTLVVLFIWTS